MISSPIDNTLVADFALTRLPVLLVVDDQPINIQLIHQIFSENHTILMATSGAQALAICANQQPDLMLLDIEMPNMNGYEVCEQIKANPLTHHIPIIFVTAHNNVLAEVRGLSVGAVDFITKPVNPEIVRARVKTHLTLKTQSDLLRSWAYIDGLTSVFNRRHFDEQLSIEWGRALRHNTSLSVAMIDVDFFKAYNDCYGHQAGDDCLRLIAATIKNKIKRPGDLVARYGGEEFICLLPYTDFAGAMTFAEQLRLQITDLAISHAKSSLQPFISISAGIASKPLSTTHPDTSTKHTPLTEKKLLEVADEQLYIAKRLGRNQISGKSL
jgi:diguanylate cyclase (GGDEF)-like protein